MSKVPDVPLVVRSPIIILGPPAALEERACYILIRLPSRWLSKPYELEEGDVALGKILEVRYGNEKLEELSGTPISFVLSRVGNTDILYVHKDSWPKLRDYGVVHEGYFMEVELDAVVKPSGERIELYPMRELRVEVA